MDRVDSERCETPIKSSVLGKTIQTAQTLAGLYQFSVNKLESYQQLRDEILVSFLPTFPFGQKKTNKTIEVNAYAKTSPGSM